MKKICIVRLSALGDCLHVLPIIESLKKEGKYSITWVLSRYYFSLFRNVKGVHFIIIDKPRTIREYVNCCRLLRKESFDVLLALQSTLRVNLLYSFIRAKRKIGYRKFRAKEGHRLFITESIKEEKKHLLDHYFCFLKKIGVSHECRPALALDSRELEKVATLVPDKKYIVVCPFSSKTERDWPLQNYKSLVQELVKNNLHVVLVGDGKKSWPFTIPNTTCLMGSIRLETLAAVIKKAELVIAPDTGPLHLADILGTRVLGIYAMSNPEASGPYYQIRNVVNRYPQALSKAGKGIEEVEANFKVRKKGVMQLVTLKDVLNSLKYLLKI